MEFIGAVILLGVFLVLAILADIVAVRVGRKVLRRARHAYRDRRSLEDPLTDLVLFGLFCLAAAFVALVAGPYPEYSRFEAVVYPAVAFLQAAIILAALQFVNGALLWQFVGQQVRRAPQSEQRPAMDAEDHLLGN